MIITNLYIYNTPLRTFRKGAIDFKDGIIQAVHDHPVDGVDGRGKYLIPGLIDIHMHIESSMTTPGEFSNTVLPLGTTTIVADAHEVANVFGYQGLVDYMAEEQELDVFYAIPSSVPSTDPALETTGGLIDEQIVRTLARHPKIIALGEIMNFKDIAGPEDTRTKRILSVFRAEKPLAPIEGHCPRIGGADLAAFVRSGIGSDHTHQDKQSILEKISAGLFLEIQEKSINAETISTLIEYDLFPYFAFVTDDVLPDHLLAHGHLNHLLIRAHQLGMRMVDVIYCATYTAAMRMQRYDRGMIAPGKIADFILLDEVDTLMIDAVYKNGVCVYQKDKGLMALSEERVYPEYVFTSIKRTPLSRADFMVRSDHETVLVRAIERELTTTFTAEARVRCSVHNGVVDWQAQGLNLLLVIERYGHQAPIKYAFVKNGFTDPAAIASSWAHDHHNILVMGTDIGKMVTAVNRLIAIQGGMIVIDSADQEHLCALPYGGIISLAPMPVLAEELIDVRQAMHASGYVSHNEIMSFATLSLLVSPALKVSDKGYVDVRSQQVLDWEAE